MWIVIQRDGNGAPEVCPMEFSNYTDAVSYAASLHYSKDAKVWKREPWGEE